MGLFYRKVPCIGLDIGEHSIKVMEIRNAGKSYEIVNFGIIPTPPGVMEGNRIIDEEGAVSALRNLADRIQADGARVAMAVSGDNVVIRSISVPVMPDNELAEAVRFEAEALLPLNGHDVAIDFVKYDTVIEAGVRSQEVLIVAVRKDIISKMVSVAQAVGFEPATVDIEPFALLRAIRTLNPPLAAGNDGFAIVNIGATCTNISVFTRDRLTFTRMLGFGGHRLSSCLAEHYHTSLEDAEATKKLIDLSGESEHPGLAVLLYQKTEILVPVIDELVAEIGRSLEFYMAQHRGQNIPRLYITGGGALLKGLTSHMSEALEMPVSVFDPTEFLVLSGRVRHMEKQIRDAGTALTKVAGLALSEVE